MRLTTLLLSLLLPSAACLAQKADILIVDAPNRPATPAVFTREGKLLLAARETDDSSGRYYTIREWRPDVGTVAVYDTMRIEYPATTWDVPARAEEMYALPNTAIVTGGYVYSTLNGPNGPAVNAGAQSATVAGTGWGKPTDWTSDDSWGRLYAPPLAIAVDPSGLAFHGYLANTFHADAFRPDGTIAWTLSKALDRSFHLPFHMVADGANSVLLIVDTLLLEVASWGVTQLGTIPPVPDSARVIYQRLAEGSIVRATVTDDSPWLTVERFTAGGQLVARCVTPMLDKGETDAFLFHREGRSFALLRASASGCRVQFFNQITLAASNPRLISATNGVTMRPSGIILRDTLFAAWEDYRSGRAAVWGTSWAVPKDIVPPDSASAVPEELSEPRSPARITLEAWPNPVHGAVRLHAGGVEGAVTELTLTDLLGQVVSRRQQAPTGTADTWYDIDVSGLPSGTYIATIRSSGVRASSLPLIVVR
ncbi:MAG: T9SS type A sorting domain-containing protein [Bacteroidetes bacterium]|nr:T9SS type A sorting domain-containing protein [Bacteroidota bacterium]